MIKKASGSILLLTLPLVMWLFFNQVANWHLHVLGNGIVVEHAHPFKNNPLPGSPFQKHHHTELEYSILSQISNITTVILVLIALGFIFSKYRPSGRHSYQVIAYSSNNPGSHKLRGPPVIFWS
jgi:cbb3-type cytochrome oxidase subunit 3